MKYETIENIIREMRDVANSHTSRDGYEVDHALAEIPIDDYADRIEEAWKREKVSIEADALNAGALLEAFRRNDKE